MSEKEVVQQEASGGDFFTLAGKVYRQGGLVSQVIVGIALILVALSMTGTPLSHITDKRFGLKQTESEQTYQLQLRTFELIEGKVMTKLEGLEKDMALMKEDMNNTKGDVKTLTQDVEGLKKKVKEMDEENAIVHAIYRKNKSNE